MTNTEFAKVVAYIGTAVNKSLTTDQAEVYFDLLGDLPFDTLKAAAKRVLMEHRFATFPSIAELREAAAEAHRGEVKALCPAEAWALAWDAVKRLDPEIEGSWDRATAGLPALVVETMRAFGVQALCYGGEPVGVVRGQFLKMFEQLAARKKREDLYPAALKAGVTTPALPASPPAAVRALLGGIGRPA